MQLKFLIIFYILKISLFADTDNFFKDNDYNYSYECELVYEYYKKHPYDTKTNLDFGKCAENAGDINTAMAAYDRAIILDENHSLTHKYRGDLYAKMGNIEFANIEYDLAESLGNTLVERAKISAYEKHKFSIFAKLTFGNDSNVEYNAEQSDMNTWLFRPTYYEEPESGLFTKEYIRLTHVYDVNPYSAFYYKSQAYIYNKNYSNYHSQDLMLSGIYTGPGWASKNLDIWIPVNLSYLLTDYGTYSQTVSINPQLKNRLGNNVLLKLEAEYAYQKYRQWEEGNKDIYSVGISFSRWFGDNHFDISYDYTRTRNTLSDSPRYFIDRDLNEFALNYTRKILNSVKLGLGYRYLKTPYEDNIATSIQTKRKDTEINYSAYISYAFIKNIGLILEYNTYDNKSNYTPSDYTKDVISVGVYFNY